MDKATEDETTDESEEKTETPSNEEEEEEDIEIDWLEDMEEEIDEDPQTLVEEAEEETDGDLPKGLKRELELDEDLDADTYDLEDAQERLRDLEGSVGKHQNEVLMLRWKQGIVAAATPKKYGESTMERLAEATGVHENTLYDCQKMVEEFLYNRSLFKKWLKEGKNGYRYWQDVLAQIRDTDEVPSDPKKKKKKREKIMNKVETLARELEKLNQMLLDIEDEDTKREVHGVMDRAMQEITTFMQTSFYQQGELADPKKPIPRSETYMDFIRRHPCAVSGEPRPDPHHESVGGTGTKGSDFSAIPLKRELHNELEDNGKEWFEAEYNVDLNELKYAYTHRFLTGQWPEGIELPTP